MTYKDPLALRLLILLLCVLETLHTACCIHDSYAALIVNFSNPVALLYISWSAELSACIECVIVGIVQAYYSWRIWRLQQNVPTIFILFFIQLVRLAFGIRANANVIIFGEWEALKNENICKLYLYLYYSFNLVVDTLIALLLVFYLYKARAHAQRNTKKIMLKLTYYAIAAGAPTIIVAITQIITYNKSDSVTYAGLLNANVKLYANSMLLMLNARRRIARKTESDSGYSMELPRITRRDAIPRPVIEVLQESIMVHDQFGAEEHFPRIEKSASRSHELPKDYTTV